MQRTNGEPFGRCGNNYGWVRFEGSRCTEFSEDDYGPCANADRSGYVFPIFEYCHFDFDSSPSSQEDYTGGNNICGDRGIVGNSVIGELALNFGVVGAHSYQFLYIQNSFLSYRTRTVSVY